MDKETAKYIGKQFIHQEKGTTYYLHKDGFYNLKEIHIYELEDSINLIKNNTFVLSTDKQSSSKPDSSMEENIYSDEYLQKLDEILRSYINELILDEDDLYFYEDIPDKKLVNAIKSYSPDINEESNLLCLYDDTVFGSADEGFLITEDSISWKIYLGEKENFNFVDYISSEIIIPDDEDSQYLVITLQKGNINKTIEVAESTFFQLKAFKIFLDLINDSGGIFQINVNNTNMAIPTANSEISENETTNIPSGTGLGKILGLAALGVGAVAAAPFTGGGSILAGAGAAASLAGVGTLAAGAGVAGAAVGAAINVKNVIEQQSIEISKMHKEINKFKNIAEDHRMHTESIVALTALGIAMANADGEISEEEQVGLDEFVNGLAAQHLPKHITDVIDSIIENPPTFNEALIHLERIKETTDISGIREMLILIMEADGLIMEKEKAFLAAYDIKVTTLLK